MPAKAMHFTSADGIFQLEEHGLAYDPTTDFIRYSDGTVNHWYKMSAQVCSWKRATLRPSHSRSIDVDKTLDLANDSHGKIIVVPFDG